MKINDKFHIKPSSINTVTDKVHTNHKNRIFKKTLKHLDSNLEDNVQDYLDKCFKVPRDKYQYPMTESQEIGWYNDHKKVKEFEEFRIENS